MHIHCALSKRVLAYGAALHDQSSTSNQSMIHKKWLDIAPEKDPKAISQSDLTILCSPQLSAVDS